MLFPTKINIIFGSSTSNNAGISKIYAKKKTGGVQLLYIYRRVRRAGVRAPLVTRRGGASTSLVVTGAILRVRIVVVILRGRLVADGLRFRLVVVALRGRLVAAHRPTARMGVPRRDRARGAPRCRSRTVPGGRCAAGRVGDTAI